ncbi:MAG: leucine-rich repeat domain-containing protein, partial [Phaeodactylibacter sp.]|nr:leucine-rich repeat domain-containing protein [Phaeodactylibacter sp.]
MKAYSLEAALHHPDAVTVLYAQGRGWRELPPGLERLKQLKILGLAGNQLSSVPEVIAELPHLEELDLSGNN